MYKRLFVLMLFALATLIVSTPAGATPIGVSVFCYQTGAQPPWFANYHCIASASGGTGSYTYTWKIYSTHGGHAFSSSEPEMDYTCPVESQWRVDVYVTDSAGATGSVMGDSYGCNVWSIDPI